MTRKDETAGKAIVNGPRGYRERARVDASDGRADSHGGAERSGAGQSRAGQGRAGHGRAGRRQGHTTTRGARRDAAEGW